MIFQILSITVPFLIYFLVPEFIQFLFKRPPVSRKLLIIAGLLFFISWYLPSPLIQSQNTAFSTHFVGGGIFTGFIWLYLKNKKNFILNTPQF